MQARVCGVSFICLVLLAAAWWAPIALAGPATVDAQAEVAAVLFNASATLAATEKSDDIKLKAERARVTAFAAC